MNSSLSVTRTVKVQLPGAWPSSRWLLAVGGLNFQLIENKGEATRRPHMVRLPGALKPLPAWRLPAANTKGLQIH